VVGSGVGGRGLGGCRPSDLTVNLRGVGRVERQSAWLGASFLGLASSGVGGFEFLVDLRGAASMMTHGSSFLGSEIRTGDPNRPLATAERRLRARAKSRQIAAAPRRDRTEAPSRAAIRRQRRPAGARFV